MAKILFSWIATNNDFVRDVTPPQVRHDGPNASVHKHLWEYDRHVLLSQKKASDGDSRLNLLQHELKQVYGHEVEPRLLGIKDVISVTEIRPKVEELLLEYEGDELHFFTSPGTPAMAIAWYFIHLGAGFDSHLFQLRRALHTDSGKPEKLLETITQSHVPLSLSIREAGTAEPSAHDSDVLLTPSIESVYAQAALVAEAPHATCLILGPSGSGKEHLARTIHRRSSRSEEPFIAVNCSAMGVGPLLESRLFGYASGSFTGGLAEGRAGLFEEANGGTVFLDEIGDATKDFQQMLLRVLQEKEVTRVGSSTPQPIDVRIVAATHRNLRAMCVAEQFRWDLFYRLSVAELHVPALAARSQQETRTMIGHFLTRLQRKYKRQNALVLSKDVWARLLAYPFPGNIRELENLIESLYIFNTETVDVEQLPAHLTASQKSIMSLEEATAKHIAAVLRYCGGNRTHAAEALGISRTTLINKIKSHRIKA
ncbi:MAG: sigma 54-interacting transcriptional regulator [Bacteroidota bacterium]